MSWVAVAVAAGSAIVGGVQANQERQRKKGVIGNAFRVAEERQKLRQGDVRQTVGESLVARGLTQGGAGGRDLASQSAVDLAKEQELERKDLASRKSGDYSDINAEANSAMIASAVNGINAGVGLHGAMTAGSPTTTPSTGAGKGVMVDTPPPGGNKYPGSFADVDPVDPLGRGAWKGPATTGGFNVFNEPGVG